GGADAVADAVADAAEPLLRQPDRAAAARADSPLPPDRADQPARHAPAAREDALRFVREALEAAASGDEAAVIASAGDALVERPVGPSRQLPQLASNPHRAVTDLAAALRVGLGILPTDRARRLVLLSDGNE